MIFDWLLFDQRLSLLAAGVYLGALAIPKATSTKHIDDNVLSMGIDLSHKNVIALNNL
jgi:diketogulonate reductase-like aldo/keto reductase